MRRLLLAAPLVALVVAGGFALTAANTVEDRDTQQTTIPQATNDTKPAACTMSIQTRIIGSGPIIAGTIGNDLIFGDSSGQSIDGLGGSDCILGGGGADLIEAGSGTDYVDGGDGVDTCSNAETTVSC